MHWVDENGLTLTEAARIQPSYSPPPPLTLPPHNRHPGNVTSVTLGSASVALLAWNLARFRSPSDSWHSAGAIVGATAFAAGGALLGTRYADSRPASFAMISGASGVLVSALTSHRRKDPGASRATGLSVLPLLTDLPGSRVAFGVTGMFLLRR
jgi:hypothetical protein